MKVIKVCTKKGWKISDHDFGEILKFDEIKKLLDQEAHTMANISVYEHEHCLRATSNRDSIPAISHSSNTPVVTAPKPDVTTRPTAPASVSVPTPVPALAPSAASIPAPPAVPFATIATIPTSSSICCVPRVSRCIWCDSPDHSRRSECTLFAEALKSGNIRINEVGHVVLSSTGAEFPPAFGHGGMKLLYDAVWPPAPSHRPLS
jgi:hypothetical protein